MPRWCPLGQSNLLISIDTQMDSLVVLNRPKMIPNKINLFPLIDIKIA